MQAQWAGVCLFHFKRRGSVNYFCSYRKWWRCRSLCDLRKAKRRYLIQMAFKYPPKTIPIIY